MFKKTLKIILVFLILISSKNVFAGNFVYPFDKISDPKCRFTDWELLEDSCKIEIPKITGADYGKYKANTTYRRIYSILWSGTYNYGWDVGFGSHLGVDIATSKGTPVKSIGDGDVVFAGQSSGRGNSITIKHTLADGKVIFSNYSHLSSISTKKGVSVKAGDYIGGVGATGNAYGNHLHFQIDTTNQSHPYWYTTCAKGKDIMALVNNGECKDYMNNNTIDPILFLEKGANFNNAEKVIEQIKEEQKKVKVDPNALETRQKIIDDEISEFFKKYNIDIKSGVLGDNFEVGKTYNFRVSVNSNGGKFSGTLPGTGIDVVYDKKALKIFPEQILLIEKGVRDFSFVGLKSGQYFVEFKIGKKILFTKTLNIYKPGEFLKPTDIKIISTKKTSYLGDEFSAFVVFRNKYGSYQYNIPYNGKYVLKLLKGYGKMCNISNSKQRKCIDFSKTVREMEFEYKDTINGILLYNFIPTDFAPVEFAVYEKGTGKTMGKALFLVNINNPKDLDKQYLYYDELISSLKKGIFRLKDGYTIKDRSLLGKQFKTTIDNYLSYKWLKAGDDKNAKQKAQYNLSKWRNESSAIDDYRKFTRGEASKLIFTILEKDNYPSNKKYFIDQKGDFENYITTLYEYYSFKWKDSFGERYFQPNKEITIGEFIYLFEKITEK
ncbi:MAG: M23 family metallopeptidase [Candidatus Gracilibacteria bacterium]|nr:M23 family metallopeptidase [Candidatus Gracilibacteria bacterium]MDD3120332.1 M23 family metallopeptidase [Candidatus Gracilibacteria bacterium]MDD4530010.1 M23 family metallopeptidase [Candidatus Gracilibacteria bacterium]